MKLVQQKHSHGSVLIVVLWASVGLVSITLLFGHSMLMAYRGADNDAAGRQADAAIEGAARYVETLLADNETPGTFLDPTTYVSEDLQVGNASFWLLGRSDDYTNNNVPVYGVVDEASKLNLNTATLDMLRQLPGISDELAAAIVDWRDTNDEVSENGAESETYLAKRPAYACKNAPFETVDELALLNGATRVILYGEDANLNGVLDPNEDDGSQSEPSDNSDGKLDAGILDYVTVFTRESNKRADGSDRVNINQPGDALRTLLTESLNESRAQEIIDRLGPGATYRSTLEWFTQSGMTAEEFGKVQDALTTSTEPYIQGLVNVNTASEAVLACIPGIGTDKASTVVGARLNRVEGDSDMTWIVEVIGQESAVQAGPYITGHSWQVSADVAAVGQHGRGYRRSRFVIDVSTGKPRVIYRQTLSPLGWALSREVRQTIAARRELR
jgi:DNA uptake protein ComE-like DNA-binding protein